MTDIEINKIICDVLNLPWHKTIEVHDCGMFGYTKCNCGKEDCYERNLEFQSPTGRVDLLKRMIARNDWYVFLSYVDGYRSPMIMKSYAHSDMISVKFMTEDGTLARTVAEFFGEKDYDEQQNSGKVIFESTTNGKEILTALGFAEVKQALRGGED